MVATSPETEPSVHVRFGSINDGRKAGYAIGYLHKNHRREFGIHDRIGIEDAGQGMTPFIETMVVRRKPGIAAQDLGLKKITCNGPFSPHERI